MLIKQMVLAACVVLSLLAVTACNQGNDVTANQTDADAPTGEVLEKDRLEAFVADPPRSSRWKTSPMPTSGH